MAAFYHTQVFHQRYIQNQKNHPQIGQLRNLYNLCALEVNPPTLLIMNLESIESRHDAKDLTKILQTLHDKRVTVRRFTGTDLDVDNLDVFTQIIFVDCHLTNVLKAWASLPAELRVYSFWVEKAELDESTLANEISTHLSLLFHPLAFD